MKKTLVALAVLTVAGTSFAQVTLSGKLGFGFQKQPSNATALVTTGDTQQGMVMTDGDVRFVAVEDLGGGMKVTVDTEIRLRGRDDAVSARNSTISLLTPVGLVSAGAIEAVSPLVSFTMAGSPVQLATNADANAGSRTSTPIAVRTNIDAISLTMPIGPVTVTALYAEVNNAGGNGALLGTVASSAGNDTGTTAYTLLGRYAAGPLALYADYTQFDSKVTAINASPVVANFYKDWGRTRLGATYNFGMAKIGVGYLTADHGYADQYSAALTVPMGAVTFGLTYAGRAEQKAIPLTGNTVLKERTFTGAGVQYDFSKQTNLNLSYGTFTGVANYSDEYRIRLLKSF